MFDSSSSGARLVVYVDEWFIPCVSYFCRRSSHLWLAAQRAIHLTLTALAGLTEVVRRPPAVGRILVAAPLVEVETAQAVELSLQVVRRVQVVA